MYLSHTQTNTHTHTHTQMKEGNFQIYLLENKF